MRNLDMFQVGGKTNRDAFITWSVIVMGVPRQYEGDDGMAKLGWPDNVYDRETIGLWDRMARRLLSIPEDRLPLGWIDVDE